MITVCEEATPGTWGSHQLLLEQYKRLDEEWITDEGSISGAWKQLNFNTQWLEYMLKKYGELHCEWCPKKYLYIKAWNGSKIPGRHMATVDHFFPRSTHPHLAFNKKNLLVSCEKCNNKRRHKYANKELIKFPYPEKRMF